MRRGSVEYQSAVVWRAKALDNTETIVTRWRKQACRWVLSSVHPLRLFSLRGEDDTLGAMPVDFSYSTQARFGFFLGYRWTFTATAQMGIKGNP